MRTRKPCNNSALQPFLSRRAMLGSWSTPALGGLHSTLPTPTLPFPAVSSIFIVGWETWVSFFRPPLQLSSSPAPPGMPCRFCFSLTMQEKHRSSLFRIAGRDCSQLKYCKRKQQSKQRQPLPSPALHQEPSVTASQGLREASSLFSSLN